jgi:hypothetical protein
VVQHKQVAALAAVHDELLAADGPACVCVAATGRQLARAQRVHTCAAASPACRRFCNDTHPGSLMQVSCAWSTNINSRKSSCALAGAAVAAPSTCCAACVAAGHVRSTAAFSARACVRAGTHNHWQRPSSMACRLHA